MFESGKELFAMVNGIGTFINVYKHIKTTTYSGTETFKNNIWTKVCKCLPETVFGNSIYKLNICKYLDMIIICHRHNVPIVFHVYT